MSSSKRETILVLYGSQTGNSEAAAKTLCTTLQTSLPTIRTRCLQLDDFIYQYDAKWTRIVVIVTSSYGVGQAPLGCHRFREFCDYIYSPTNDLFLKGIQFALLGLGDSQYKTFFKNPTRIDEALRSMGAKRIGPLGKADASGTGEEEQEVVVERWIEGIVPVLEKALMRDKPGEEVLDYARQRTVAISTNIFPDYPPLKKKDVDLTMVFLSVTVMFGIVAIILGRWGVLEAYMERFWDFYDSLIYSLS